MGRHGVTRYDIASVQRWSLSPRTSDVGYFFKIVQVVLILFFSNGKVEFQADSDSSAHTS